MEDGETVCVTGASGFIGSWLVMKLLERGYFVKATVRDPGNMNKVKHLLDLPKASTHLSLWRGELAEEGSFDDAIQGCTGVFHVATPMDIASVRDPENDMIRPTINGVLNVMQSSCKAKSVKRFIYTSTTGTIVYQRQLPQKFDESFWTDVDYCCAEKMPGWTYLVSKTLAEKAAWKFVEENDLDLVTIHPPLVVGPFLTPSVPESVNLATSLITRNQYQPIYQKIMKQRLVHIEDVCNAHIFLYEHPQANGRYVCSTHSTTIVEIAKSLSQKHPEYNVPTKFEGVDESLKPIPFPSKRLQELGFTFKYDSGKYDPGDLLAETYEFCRQKLKEDDKPVKL